MPTLPIDSAEQPREHVTDVCETAVAEHRCAVRELADRTSQILRVAAREIHEQLPDNSAVLGITLGKRPNLLEVLLQRCRHCTQPQAHRLIRHDAAKESVVCERSNSAALEWKRAGAVREAHRAFVRARKLCW